MSEGVRVMKRGPMMWSRTLAIMSGIAFSLVSLSSCSTIVAPPPAPAQVASVEVVPDQDTLDVSGTLHLTAMPEDDDGNPLPDRPVAWSSNNTSVVSVDGTGWIA